MRKPAGQSLRSAGSVNTIFAPASCEYEGDCIRGELDVDGHRDDAGAHAAQQCRDEFHAIERQDADPVARNETGARAAARHGIAHLVERAIADFARACRVVQIDDGYALGIRMRSKQRSQVAGIAAWFGFRNRGRQPLPSWPRSRTNDHLAEYFAILN